MTIRRIQRDIQEGIPARVPRAEPYDSSVNHAPKRKQILSIEGEELALKNALRYLPPEQHAELLPDFKHELETYGRIYMYCYHPDYKLHARDIRAYPGKCDHAKAIMLMIHNN